MPTLKEVFTGMGLGRVADGLAAIAQPSVRLAAVDYGEASEMRMGGRPNLPAEVVWPAADYHLPFLAQIDLAAIPAIPGLDLPRSGALYFFYEGEGAVWEWEQRAILRVVYTESSLDSLPLRDFPEDVPEEYRYKGVKLSVERGELTFPGVEDHWLEEVGMNDAEREAYSEFKDRWDDIVPPPRQILQGYPAWIEGNEAFQASYDQQRPFGVHRIGGYPDCIQHDPKFEAHMIARGLYSGLHARLPDPQESMLETVRRFQEAKEREGAGAREWQTLLQIDSEQSADIMWGDVGRLYYLIRKDDLQQRRFDNVWMVMSCH